MDKYFNINGVCYPEEHYMVNIDQKLAAIRKLIDEKKYFVMNRARQYGKTTTLNMLVRNLSDQYTVFFISFEGLGDSAFESESAFCGTVCELLADTVAFGEVPMLQDNVREIILNAVKAGQPENMLWLSGMISEICGKSENPVVLMIDEVDQASGHKVFLDFLGMLRSKFMKRVTRPTFQSVILAGVYDIKNLKQRIRDEKEHQYNSPWNIAADFNVDMSFTEQDIAGMLQEYSEDRGVSFDVGQVAKAIHDYTSGYPYLVSKICKLIDENISGGAVRSTGAGCSKAGEKNVCEKWSAQGVADAVSLLLKEPNTLFDDIRKKLSDFPELRKMLYAMLFRGETYPYNPDNYAIDIGTMFGIVKEKDGQTVVSNRIFETRIYNLFLSEEMTESITYQLGERDKNQFVKSGVLDMDLVMEKFMVHFHDVYGSSTDKFVEENGRRLFLLYLKPIINGTGSYYIEAQTRDQTRTGIIVDYLGKQYVVELKIWRGEEYNRRGEKQLTEYLDYYHLEKGYLLSFNFNKNKKTGMKPIRIGNRILVEVVI